MKLTTLIAAACLFLPFTATAKEGIEYRKFTATNGNSISAVIVDKNETAVVFLLENGKRATVPLTTLSEDDRSYVKSWNKAKAVFLRECRSLSVGELLTLRGYEAIPIKLEGNTMMVQLEINGKPAKMVLDTGAGSSLLHTGACKRVGAALGPFDYKVYGVSGEAPAALAQVDEFKVGEAVFKDRQIMATDMAKDMAPGAKVRDDGLLGAEVLSDLEAVITYRERKLFIRPDRSDVNETEGDTSEDALSFRIFKTKRGKIYRGLIASKTSTVATIAQQNGKNVQVPISLLSPEDAAYVISWTEARATFLRHCRSLTINELLELRQYLSFEYERRGNHIFVDGKLNDNDVTWMIDTGADNSLLHIDAAKEHGAKVGSMTKEVWGVGGKAPAAATDVDSVSLGKAVFRKRKILATDLDRFDSGLDYVGLFGADFLRETYAVITYKEKRIFLKQE
ncbi:aspartyl protease family protein [Verrucomicrobiaceae bacterium 5K15]|uniref:Aspartyl protease family protein n=1 Tax=Oceaniferula flava TaxID=2800421 RepID=A0AAE2VCE6_9BACT|nr:aspartyl protease family protein [Oceaniferula flavus]MBK1854906.1 aspartyl protease family protein [Oceaniferula flavus]MBM1136212.1 aspartyl protease family protein [Oceaniferula flavus]